ncbi:DUF2950 domain-containing protein [Kaistia dalseonensis]|uniref:DUF2950 domain-containing protein n=1 Tax=Kaistia dalseonensis TaxID=410840 RepID=A0ABU0H0X8_9HYPH|nr:DUF2950 domain-containing protein [Kaistia dalseonensis]MCX5493403.1 DUF2950 domain-containing protein [Kaistia dalseonensis]MDQ0435961.1 hypothetical protein [Kaistia dalseonensis]
MMNDRTSLLGALIAAGLSLAAFPALAQQVFPTPEAASAALVEAAKAPGNHLLDKIFGPGGEDLLSSGDPAVDSDRLSAFLDLASRGMAVIDGKDGEKLLTYGQNQWSFPIPLKSGPSGWTFDLAAGRQAVTDREIGRNELLTIAACADYVAAQNEYFGSLHDDEPVQQYAQHFISTPGLHDGLFWEPETQADRSPLGDRIAAATVRTGEAEGAPRSYQGYFYRILTRQGPEAPGGAYDYMVNGRLLAGYALVAYPEKWGETGIMTFLCDQRGNVYERNLGPSTAKTAAAIRAFNPGPDWQVVPE